MSLNQEDVADMITMIEEGTDVDEAFTVLNDKQLNRSSKFDMFWQAAEEVLASEMVVPDERRHGTTCCISPLCVSLRDLMNQVVEKAKIMFPNQSVEAPSEEYFRLQFAPRNENCRTASRYYKRFNIKWVLQTRLLQKSHVDQHFGAKQFQYLKLMSQRFAEHALMIFMDDKASVPVGHPNTPVSATKRQRKVLAAGVGLGGLTAADHDVIPMHLTPSVSIILSPPTNEQSWYSGKPEVILKDSIFEASSAFRHATELLRRINSGERRPILFLGTDGGPDHNVTNIQVILSLVAVFLESEADCLVAVRTPPHFSVINPVERLMSTLNYALTGVALARDILPWSEEKIVSHIS